MDPVGPRWDEHRYGRVFRGGCWRFGHSFSQSGFSFGQFPAPHFISPGFRPVLVQVYYPKSP